MNVNVEQTSKCRLTKLKATKTEVVRLTAEREGGRTDTETYSCTALDDFKGHDGYERKKDRGTDHCVE